MVLAAPPQEPMIPRKVLVWTGVIVALLIAGLVFMLAQLKDYYEKRAAAQRQKSGAPAHTVTNPPAKSALNP